MPTLRNESFSTTARPLMLCVATTAALAAALSATLAGASEHLVVAGSHAAHPRLYASFAEYLYGFDQRNIYKGPVFMITGLHSGSGLYIDPSGNLYVPQSQSPGVVNVYPPGKTTPSEQLAPNDGTPFNPCGDVFGNVYVPATPDGGYDVGIFKFAPGSTNPVSEILVSDAQACATDAAGDLFVSSIVTGGPVELWNVFEFPYPPSQHGITVQSGYSNAFTNLEIGFDADNRLVVGLQLGGTVSFSIYGAPYTGNPVRQFSEPLGGVGPFAFAASGRSLWVVDGSFPTDTIELDYRTGRRLYSLGFSAPIQGIALGPALLP